MDFENTEEATDTEAESNTEGDTTEGDGSAGDEPVKATAPWWTNKANTTLAERLTSEGEATDEEYLLALQAEAVAQAREKWLLGITEAKSMPEVNRIAQEAGWGYGVANPKGGNFAWCGMFVAACYFLAGMPAGKEDGKTSGLTVDGGSDPERRDLRPGLFETSNVVHFFTYAYEQRVPRWVWTDEGAWKEVRAFHADRSAERTWISGKSLLAMSDEDLAAAVAEVRAGDVMVTGKGEYGGHIRLVESYDADSGEVTTLEGNAGGDELWVGTDENGDPKTEKSFGPAVIRNHNNLLDRKFLKNLCGIGRLSVRDFEQRIYRTQKPGSDAPKRLGELV